MCGQMRETSLGMATGAPLIQTRRQIGPDQVETI
jgi:hypothetical protein